MTKKLFPGFPTRAEVTPIPTVFFIRVMPLIEDIAELKTILHIFWLLSRRRGYPQFVTYNELLSDPILISNLGKETKSVDEKLRYTLQLVVQHGIMLHLELDRDGEPEDIYFINTESEKKIIDTIQQGELVLPGLIPKKEVTAKTVPPSDIFSLYEQNIGMLTPIIAEELQEAEKLYPAAWIESAFKEAVTLNKRSWKYISRILERWAIEGKDDGKPGRDFKREGDPDKYIRGKYGHMVRR